MPTRLETGDGRQHQKISVALPADRVNLVRRAVATDDSASGSEVIREALREWKTRRVTRTEALAEMRKLWEEGIASGPTEDLDVAASKRGGQTIKRHILLLETTPDIARPFPEMPGLRERVIAFGDSGYVALCRHEPADDAVYVPAFRHQKEAGY